MEAGGLGVPDRRLALRPRASNWSTNCHKLAQIREDRNGSTLLPRPDQQGRSDVVERSSEVVAVLVLSSQMRHAEVEEACQGSPLLIWLALHRGTLPARPWAGREPASHQPQLARPGNCGRMSGRCQAAWVSARARGRVQKSDHDLGDTLG